MGLLIDNKQLMLEWDWDSNNAIGLVPDVLTPGSNKVAHWVCKNGHKWKAAIYTRTKGHGCPQCAQIHLGKKRATPKTGESLQELFPDIAKEWNYNKNKELPIQVCAKSNKKVWWVCSVCKHEWESFVCNRVSGRGCPNCSRIMRTSEPERIVYFYIKKYFDDTIWSYKHKQFYNLETDIYIPSCNIGIEYDGQAWHKNTERDLNKDQICEEFNIQLIRIREPNCPSYQTTARLVCLKNLSRATLADTITDILISLGISNPDVDIKRDKTKIDDLIVYRRIENSLATKFPEIAKEWNYQRNGKIAPENVMARSSKKVWWKCLECGYEWESTIANRTKGNRCPECSKMKLSSLYSKPVKCIELNQVFINGYEASKQLGVSQSRINQNCNDKCEYAGKHPVTSEKLHWEYVD